MPFLDKSTLTYPVYNSFPGRRYEDTRDPTSADYKQFNITDMWFNTALDSVWVMADKSSAAGTWVLIGSSTTPNIIKMNVDAHTAPGTDPVLADSTGTVTITGAQVASGTIGTNVIRTDSLAANAYTVEIQRSTAVAATDLTKNGVSHFNSTQFSVDSNGFVTLAGGGEAIDSFIPDSGTTPVVPNAFGQVTMVGGTGINTVGGTNTLTFNASGDVATTYVSDSGSATPALNILNIVGGAGITTNASGDTVTISTSNTGFIDINIQTFTANGTYTPTAGMAFCEVEVVAGGGGGGGAAATGADKTSAGAGGGAGGYARSLLTAADIGASKAVTIGAGGAGGAAGFNNGSSGGASSLGVLVAASGGAGGLGQPATGFVSASHGGAGGSGTAGDILVDGDDGLGGLALNCTVPGGASDSGGLAGAGGSSVYGGGALGNAIGGGGGSTAGANGGLYGGGGGGAISSLGNAAAAGGNGAAGIIIIKEYIGSGTGGNLTFVTDSGNATPTAGVINVLGTSGATTSGSGDTVTIASSSFNTLQQVRQIFSTPTTCTSVIPVSASAPTSSQGDLLTSLAITPTSNTSVLLFEASFYMCGSAADISGALALFIGAGATAVAAASSSFTVSGDTATVTLRYYMTSGTTSPLTFNVRVGPTSAGTIYINSLSGSALWASAALSTITITEYDS